MALCLNAAPSNMLPTFNPVFRRTVGDGPDGTVTYELPPWSAWIFLADLVILVPLFFFVSNIPRWLTEIRLYPTFRGHPVY